MRSFLVKSFQCAHCGSPIAVLDADAVEKTLAQLEQAEARKAGDPAAKEARARALAAMESLRSRPEKLWDRGPARSRAVAAEHGGVDLLSASLGALLSKLL
jgi:hypothetical protein